MRALSRWFVGGMLGGLVAMAPNPASASVFQKSSMTAACTTEVCDVITFVLEVDTNIWVDWVRIYSADLAIWDFKSLLGATDANGSSLGWEWYLREDGLYIKAGGYLAPEPIRLTALMEVYSPSKFYDHGRFHYNGLGNLEPTGEQETQVVVGGYVTPVVTPEPGATFLLVGGLFGLLSLRRRRRQEHDVGAGLAG